jgi:hypothetical protein
MKADHNAEQHCEFDANSIHDAKIVKVTVFYRKMFKRINRKTVEKPIAP